MVTMFKPKPQFFRFVSKPANASTKELAEARPVYIDGLPEGGTVTIADVEGLQGILEGLEQRVSALESGG